MSKPTIPFALPADLSTQTVRIESEVIGSLWDVGVNGQGFMLSTLDQESPFEFRSYEIQSIPIQKPRIDDAQEPGEQTLASWWSRAQHSWHEGAGQHIFDSPFSSRFRFSNSFGIDIWNDGQISLLKTTEELFSDVVDDIHLYSGPNALFYTHNGELTRDPDPLVSLETNETTLTTKSGTPINSITSDGERLFAAFSGITEGIQSTPLDGTLAWSLVNELKDADVIAWVKGRLMGAKGASVFEFDLSATAAPVAHYTDPADGYEFTDITESGPGIYFSGRLGDRSEIWIARLAAADITAGLTLGALRVVWTAPEGESIHSIHGYGGQQILIGTSLGVRIGTVVTGEGDIEVSGLITRSQHGTSLIGTDNPVLAFEPQFEFAWFGWTRFDSTFTGVGRIHLGNLAWASDLMFSSTGDVTDIVYYSDKIFFVVHDPGVSMKVIMEHDTDFVSEGFFTHNEIRFATTELKQLRFFDILTSGTGGLWSLEVSSEGGPFIPLNTDNAVGGYQERRIDVEATRVGLKVILKPDILDLSNGPTGLEWRFRADPRVSGRFRYFATLMVYDFVETQNGKEIGEIGKAMRDLSNLTALYRNMLDFIFQGPESNLPNAPAFPVVMLEDLRFKLYAPPEASRGYGGLCLLVMREVE